MDKQVVLVLAAIAILAFLRMVIWAAMQRRPGSPSLSRYGPRFRLRALSPDERQRFTASWREIEDRFAEDPTLALSQADRQVVEVMHARGYPVTSLEEHPEEMAREDPDLVENFRAARRYSRVNGDASRHVMKQAMVHYRALFDDLVETPEWQQARR